jgi:hypothetical protein
MLSQQIENIVVGVACIAAAGYVLWRLVGLLRGKSDGGCSKCSGSSNCSPGSPLSSQPSQKLHQINSNDDDV